MTFPGGVSIHPSIPKTMKKPVIVFLLLFMMAFSVRLYAEDPPPPPNGGGTPVGSGGTPVGGAPLDGGIGILLMLGAGYGGVQLFSAIRSRSRTRSAV